DDSEISEKIRQLRDCGRSNKSGYIHDYIGYTARLNTVNAAIGRKQLSNLDNWVKRRSQIANIYKDELNEIKEIILPPEETNSIHPAWHLFVIRTKKRDKLNSFLRDSGIRCGIHYPLPVHLQPPYKNKSLVYRNLQNSEKWSREVLSLPIHNKLSDNDVFFIIEKIKGFFR
ncbi:MAG: DegT/DnrJ/EryC1/StrS family aminotransferase, partial [Candidatus Heimdallarchaeaceae archaeon]